MALPAYNLKAIAKLRRKLTEHPAIWPFYNLELTGDSFALFVATMDKLLGGKIPGDALTETCMDLLGQELTRKRLGRFAMRVAANAGRLRKGRPVPPWTAQLEAEWAPVEVLRGWQGRNRKDDPGYYYEFRVLAGTPVGQRLVKFWSIPQYHYVARDLGFSRKEDRPLMSPLLLVRLRFLAHFEPKLSQDGPGFQQVRVTGALLKYNTQLLDERFSREPGCPPRKFLHACYTCWLGYDECPYAVHPRAYVQRACPDCREPEAWFDPAEPMDRCIACAARVRMMRKKDD